MYFDKKTHLGPQNVAYRDLSCVYQVLFQKSLNRIYHQDMLGAFIQKHQAWGPNYKSQIPHFFVEMEGYGPSNDIKLTDI